MKCNILQCESVPDCDWLELKAINRIFQEVVKWQEQNLFNSRNIQIKKKKEKKKTAMRNHNYKKCKSF
jgi:hypothetical protein